MTEEIEKLCAECEEYSKAYGFFSDMRGKASGLLDSCVVKLREMDAEHVTCNALLGATCTRAEKAEAELAELRPENAHWQKILSKATENL